MPDQRSTTWPRIAATGRFCVNVLAHDQEALCRQFARPGPDKFSNVAFRTSPRGAPVLEGVVAWIDCAVEAVHPAGDHWIAIGRVLDLAVERVDAPLLFFRGAYGAFAPNS